MLKEKQHKLLVVNSPVKLNVQAIKPFRKFTRSVFLYNRVKQTCSLKVTFNF